MSKILGLLLICAAVVALALFALFLVGMLVALARVLLELVSRALLALGVAAVAGACGGVVANLAGAGDPAEVGVYVGLAGLVPAVIIAWRWRGPFANRAVLATEPGMATMPFAPAPPPSAPEPVGDEGIGAAWEQAAQLAPVSIARLRSAREACAGVLLKMQETDRTGSYDWLEMATLIRRHVRPLVEETQRACDGADGPERELLCNQLVERLESLGGRAQELLDRDRAAARENVAIRHAHLANQLKDDAGLGGAAG